MTIVMIPVSTEGVIMNTEIIVVEQALVATLYTMMVSVS